MADETKAILEGRESASKRKSFFKRKKSKESPDDPNAPRTSKEEPKAGDDHFTTVETFAVPTVKKPEDDGSRPSQSGQPGQPGPPLPPGQPGSPRQSLKPGSAGILNYQRKSGPPPTAEYLDRTIASLSRQQAIELHQKLSNDLEKSKAKLANIAGILMELSEAYYDLTKGCYILNAGKMDLIVQESLAAYERRIVRQDETQDTSEWTNLIACQIEGRCRRNTVLAKSVQRNPESYNSTPDAIMKAEITQMVGDQTLYQRRIERDEARIRQLGTNWAKDKQAKAFCRLCKLRDHVRLAITDYSMDMI